MTRAQRRQLAGAILWCVFASLSAVHAAPVDGLYTARARVGGSGAAERDTAIASALSQVMVRVAGSDAQSVALDLPNPQRLVSRYQYVRQGDGLALEVEFAPAAVDSVLNDLGLAPWGSERPLTLVWLAYQRPGERGVLDRERLGSERSSLDAALTHYGLPALLPENTTGPSAVSVLDVTGGFEDRVLNASQRYSADGVLMGVLFQQSDGQWEGRWTLLFGAERLRWQTGPDTMEVAVDDAIRRLSRHYRARFAPGGAGPSSQELILEVNGIRQFDDYARVMTYLQSLSSVRYVDVDRVEGQLLALKLAFQGSAENLIRSVELGGFLRENTTPRSIESTLGEPGSLEVPAERPAVETSFRFDYVPALR